MLCNDAKPPERFDSGICIERERAACIRDRGRQDVTAQRVTLDTFRTLLVLHEIIYYAVSVQRNKPSECKRATSQSSRRGARHNYYML